MNLYRSKNWKLFRAEAVRLAEGRCGRCFHSNLDGAILHVHHRQYVLGRKPWEYPHYECEVLCQSCHAQEHGIVPPKSDWELVGYDDLEAPDANCEYCGTEIWHVFMIQHPRWITLEVGEICCDNLTNTSVATAYMIERRRILDRRKRFVSRWVEDPSGPHIDHRGIHAKIIAVDKSFKLRMNGEIGKLCFTNLLDAKMKAFEVIDSGAAGRYFKKRRAPHRATS